MQVGSLETILPEDHSCRVCFKLAYWFQKKKIVEYFPTRSYVKNMSVDGGYFE